MAAGAVGAMGAADVEGAEDAEDAAGKGRAGAGILVFGGNRTETVDEGAELASLRAVDPPIGLHE